MSKDKISIKDKIKSNISHNAKKDFLDLDKHKKNKEKVENFEMKNNEVLNTDLLKNIEDKFANGEMDLKQAKKSIRVLKVYLAEIAANDIVWFARATGMKINGKPLIQDTDYHLIEILETVGRMLIDEEYVVSEKYDEDGAKVLDDEGNPVMIKMLARYIIVNAPPRHKKTVLVKYVIVPFAIGLNRNTRIAVVSYGEELSKTTSQDIKETVLADYSDTYEFPMTYADIFGKEKPDKRRNGSVQWSLDNVNEETMVSLSIHGSGATGKGFDLLIVDDVLSGYLQARSVKINETINNVFENTLLSRLGGKGKMIMIQTRWSDMDLTAHMIKPNDDGSPSPYMKELVHLKYPAYDRESGEMLDENTLSYDQWLILGSVLAPGTFEANYQQEEISMGGRLYSRIQLYDDKENTKGYYDKMVATLDFADGDGGDYTAMVIGTVDDIEGKFYVRDVYYRNDDGNKQIRNICKKLKDNKVEEIRIESNYGGQSLIDVIKQELAEINYSLKIIDFKEGSNKFARISLNSGLVSNYVYFPERILDAGGEFEAAYRHLLDFTNSEEGNANDDIEDALTMITTFYLQPIHSERLGIDFNTGYDFY